MFGFQSFKSCTPTYPEAHFLLKMVFTEKILKRQNSEGFYGKEEHLEDLWYPEKFLNFIKKMIDVPRFGYLLPSDFSVTKCEQQLNFNNVGFA